MVHALLMVILGGAEQLGPAIDFPSQPTAVRVDDAPVGVATTPAGVVVAWTDPRRSEAIFPKATPISDLWLRTLGGAPAELICQQKAPAAAPSLAWFGRLGLAWRHSSQLDRISVAVRGEDGGWGAGQECGLLLANDAGASGPVVIARPSLENGLVLFETAPERLVGVEAIGTTMAYGGLGTRPAGIEAGGSLYVGAFFDGGIESRKDTQLEATIDGQAFAYASDPGLRKATLFSLSSNGNLLEHGTSRVAGPFRGQLFATTVGSPVAFAETGAGLPSVWWPGAPPRSLRMAGTAVGVTEAARGDAGVAFIRTSTGELLAVGFTSELTTQAVRVAESHGLQRLPSVAWSNGRWAVAAEQHTDAWWGAVGTLTFDPVSVSASSVPPVVWPRLLTHPSGSLLVLFGATGVQGIAAFVPPALPDFAGAFAVDAELEGAVVGRTSVLAWKPPVTGRHEEVLLRSGQTPIITRQDGALRCAAWAAGEFAVTRKVGGEARVVTFGDGELPGNPGSPLAALDACVASRPLVEPTEFGLATVEAAAIVISRLGGGPKHVVPTGVAPREVRLAPLPAGWIVIWEDEDGLEAAVVDDEGTPRSYRLDSSGPRLRGSAALATNPAGEALVVWPAVVGDGVVLRARRFTPIDVADGGTSPDGGADAGLDAGADGGMNVAFEFKPACGCASPVPPVLFALLVVLARLRRGVTSGF